MSEPLTTYHDPDCQLGCVYECTCGAGCDDCAPALAAFASEDNLEAVRNAAIAVIEEVHFSEDGSVAPNVDIDGQANDPEPWRNLRDALFAEAAARSEPNYSYDAVGWTISPSSDFACMGCGNETHIDIDHPVDINGDRLCLLCTCQRYMPWSQT